MNTCSSIRRLSTRWRNSTSARVVVVVVVVVVVAPHIMYLNVRVCRFARASSKPSEDVDQAAFKAALRTTDRTDTDLSLYPANTHRWLLALLRRVGLTLSLPGVCHSSVGFFLYSTHFSFSV